MSLKLGEQSRRRNWWSLSSYVPTYRVKVCDLGIKAKVRENVERKYVARQTDRRTDAAEKEAITGCGSVRPTKKLSFVCRSVDQASTDGNFSTSVCAGCCQESLACGKEQACNPSHCYLSKGFCGRHVYVYVYFEVCTFYVLEAARGVSAEAYRQQASAT